MFLFILPPTYFLTTMCVCVCLTGRERGREIMRENNRVGGERERECGEWELSGILARRYDI